MHVTANGGEGHEGSMKAVREENNERGGQGDLHDMGEKDWISLSRAMVFKLSYEG